MVDADLDAAGKKLRVDTAALTDLALRSENLPLTASAMGIMEQVMLGRST